jgi:putative acetyltransferase
LGENSRAAAFRFAKRDVSEYKKLVLSHPKYISKVMMMLRPVQDQDATGLFALVGSCFAQHEGVFLEPDGLDRDLNAYASEMARVGGEGFVIEEAGKLIAFVSGVDLGEGAYQLKRLYLDPNQHGSGIALKLLRHIEECAHAKNAATIELWSDTRFTRAHRFYEREGYVKQAETKALHDSSNTIEFQFIKTL